MIEISCVFLFKFHSSKRCITLFIDFKCSGVKHIHREVEAQMAVKITAEMLEWQEESGYTMREIVTIASMIEKEAANDTEQYTIASVIYNRLKKDWPLQIDSTTLYEYPDHEGAPTAEMLAKDSPYNTRISKGLPPSPICSPGITSIRAALQPSSTNYMYYALNTATGQHEFFTSADAFNAFVATQNYER